jgi:hypothetical protein
VPRKGRSEPVPPIHLHCMPRAYPATNYNLKAPRKNRTQSNRTATEKISLEEACQRYQPSNACGADRTDQSEQWHPTSARRYNNTMTSCCRPLVQAIICIALMPVDRTPIRWHASYIDVGYCKTTLLLPTPRRMRHHQTAIGIWQKVEEARRGSPPRSIRWIIQRPIP